MNRSRLVMLMASLGLVVSVVGTRIEASTPQTASSDVGATRELDSREMWETHGGTETEEIANCSFGSMVCTRPTGESTCTVTKHPEHPAPGQVQFTFATETYYNPNPKSVRNPTGPGRESNQWCKITKVRYISCYTGSSTGPDDVTYARVCIDPLAMD